MFVRAMFLPKYHNLIDPQENFRGNFIPLPDDKILDWSKLKQIADDILKCI